MQERKKLSKRRLIVFYASNEKKLDRDMTDKNRVEKIAKAKNISMAQLSLAWIMSQRGIFFPLLSFFPLNNKISRRVGTHCWNDLS